MCCQNDENSLVMYLTVLCGDTEINCLEIINIHFLFISNIYPLRLEPCVPSTQFRIIWTVSITSFRWAIYVIPHLGQRILHVTGIFLHNIRHVGKALQECYVCTFRGPHVSILEIYRERKRIALGIIQKQRTSQNVKLPYYWQWVYSSQKVAIQHSLWQVGRFLG